jgi:fructokinase
MVRKKVGELLNGYVKAPQMDDLDSYIVPAALKDDQGIMGCLQLAKLELENTK